MTGWGGEFCNAESTRGHAKSVGVKSSVLGDVNVDELLVGRKEQRCGGFFKLDGGATRGKPWFEWDTNQGVRCGCKQQLIVVVIESTAGDGFRYSAPGAADILGLLWCALIDFSFSCGEHQQVILDIGVDEHNGLGASEFVCQCELILVAIKAEELAFFGRKPGVCAVMADGRNLAF